MTGLLTACRDWPAATDEAGREAIRAAVRAALAVPAPGRDLADFDAAIASASAAATEAAARELFARVTIPDPAPAVPVVRPSGDWRAAPQPAPVLWRDDPSRKYADSMAAAGEVAVLAGAGKGGKSYLAVALAIAAAQAARNGQPYGDTCGLRIRAGRVVILSYEDGPKRIDMRAAAMGGDPGDVLILPDPPRVYGMDPLTRRWGETAAWAATWAAIRAVKPVLVVIDTGPKAMGGETNDPGAVIGFLQAMEREARGGDFAVLVTAHDTKAARDASRSGAELDAGAIAGSGQWHDSPRGVLHLTKTGPGDADRILEAVKCSYGRDGWGARLAVLYCSGHYAGLQVSARLDDAGVQAARAGLAAPPKGKVPATAPGRPAKGGRRAKP